MSTPPIYHLVYVSTATRPFSREQLIELLAKSRTNNAKVGVTGLLLYKDGLFIQVLEGPRAAVEQVFQRISQDPRHDVGATLQTGETNFRQFPDWSMGFSDLDDPAVRQLPGFSDFMNHPLAGPGVKMDPKRIMQLLEIFRDQL
jgi:hypothetical protein